jgi:quercetin dioxygenase-like cupin family protein
LGYDKVFHWRDIEPVEVRKGFFRRTLIEGEKLTVVLSEIIPGSSGAPHTHPEEQVMFFLQGSCKDPDGTMYESGTVTYVASGKEHGGLLTIGDEPSIVLELFAPPRKRDPLVGT